MSKFSCVMKITFGILLWTKRHQWRGWNFNQWSTRH